MESKDFSHEDEEPMEIMVTEAGRTTARLYALLRQIIPILENPESFADTHRQNLVDAIRMELEGVGNEGDTRNWLETEA